jgi:hypothetical protein
MTCAYCKRKSDRVCGDCRLRLCPSHGATHYGTWKNDVWLDDECPTTPLKGNKPC